MKTAIVLLSGGLDSTTTLGIAISQGYCPVCLSFDYGQRHKKELESCRDIAHHYGVPHKTVKIDLSFLSQSALINPSVDVPLNRTIDDTIPPTWVPQRNTIFLSIAAALAETRNAKTIFIGANQLDYSGYPDCRLDFLISMEETINLASKDVSEGGQHIEIMAPLLFMTKAEIIQKGTKLNVPYNLTRSCYQGKNKACGICDSCQLRLEAFKSLGLIDPIPYEDETLPYRELKIL